MLLKPLVIEGRDVDVLAPFPARLLPQAVQWMRCHPSTPITDASPQTDEAIAAALAIDLSTSPSFAIVDKANLVRSKSTSIPVVGMVRVVAAGPWTAYIEVAANRRAWGEKLAKPALLEQGVELVLQHLVQGVPDLMRVCAAPLQSNVAAVGLFRRLGFAQEGVFAQAVRVKGQPKALVHFGLYLQDGSQEEAA